MNEEDQPNPEQGVDNAVPKKKRVRRSGSASTEVSAATRGTDTAPAVEAAAPVETPKKRRGRPPKAKAAEAAVETPAQSEAKPKRRGRPPKAAVASSDAAVETLRRKPGRPRKQAAETVAAVVETSPVPPPATPPAETGKRRGRPPKARAEQAETPTDATPKRRGRPPKAAVTAAAETPKRRGRPPKAAVATASEPKRRGRPPKAPADAAAMAPKRRGRPPKVDAAEPRRRGRPPKAASGEMPARRVVVKQGGQAPRTRTPAALQPVFRPAEREAAPARRVVLRQGVTRVQYRKAIAAKAEALAAAAPRAAAVDTRRAVSAEPDYNPPARRIAIRVGMEAAYRESLLATPAIPEVESPVTTPVVPVGDAESAVESVSPTPPRRLKRVEGAAWASSLDGLLRAVLAEPTALATPDVVQPPQYEGEPPPPRKRPGRKPATVPKKRRTKPTRNKGGPRRGRKPRKPGVLAAGVRRRTVDVGAERVGDDS